MGSSTNDSLDVAKHKPIRKKHSIEDPPASTIGATGGGGGGYSDRPVDACLDTYDLVFVSSTTRDLTDTKVHLLLGSPGSLRVIAGRSEIGEVDDPIADAISSCLASGYKMVGKVLEFDTATRRGVLQVRGAKDR